MIRLRPYKREDGEKILSWSDDKRAFYQWSAGVLGEWPVDADGFLFVEKLMPFTAFDDDGIVGFFTLREPRASHDELRMGFVIVDPEKRGKGYGREMVLLGIRFAFEMYGADKVSLGVFENNAPAYRCYEAAGFRDVTLDPQETYPVMGEEWKCREMVIVKDQRTASYLR